MSLSGTVSSDKTIVGKIGVTNTIHGKSAYEIALLHGFEGTEEEWVDYIESNSYVLTEEEKEDVANRVEDKISPNYTKKTEFNSFKAETENDVNVLEARMNTFTTLENGSTTGDAELQDIRVGADGKVYDSAGEAVRVPMKELIDKMESKISYNELVLTPSYLVANGGKFADYNSGYVTGYVFPVSKGVTYEISITGEHNRFFVNGCYVTPAFNSAYEIITGRVDNITNTLRVTNTGYNYFFVGVGYDMDTSNVSLSVKYDINTIIHTGKPYIETLISDFVGVGVDESKTLQKEIINAKGIILPIRHNRVYELTVNGYHNRFLVCGVKGFPVDKCIVDHILLSPDVFPNIHTNSFVNDDYDYMVINIGYNIETDATLTVREYEKATYELIQENKELIQESVEKIISRSFYTTKSDVSCVTTTSEVYELYDKLVTDYPSFSSMHELGSNIREYVFTTGDYNKYTPKRNIDSIIAKPIILIHSGTHGYERSSVMSTYQFFRDLCENKSYLENLRGNYTFKVIPVVCPTSYDNNSRVNANGVNIARNYSAKWVLTENDGNDYSGASACDQIETQICEEWLRNNQNAVLFIDHHNSGYIEEVACLMSTVSMKDISDIKKSFLKAIHSLIGYWINDCEYSNTLTYGYTGKFQNIACAYQYADSIGIKSCCLETSWQQNNESLHSVNTIRTGAEILGNMLVEMVKNL